MSRLAYLRKWRARLIFWGGGAAVGAAAAGFTWSTDRAIHGHDWLTAHAPILSVALAPIGLPLIVFLTRRVFPGSQGSGIPQAIAALDVSDRHARSKLLSLRTALAKVGLTTLGLLCGASIGREGPTVQVGAAIMHTLGRWMDVPYQSVQRSLILAGSAAGVAAAFNTPIAGIVFAVEEMARSFEERTTGTLLTTVVISGVISIGLLGNYTYFGHHVVVLENGREWIAVLLCGVVAGGLGGGFSRTLLATSARLAPYLQRQPLRVAFMLGLMIAFLGLISHGATFGSGYAQARALLTDNGVSGNSPGPAFPLLKFAATLASYLSGIPGGIFSPSLSTGVGIGSDLSVLVPSVPTGAMMILGMVGYFSGVTQAPLTGAVIVMEMVDDHALILPILATAFVATVISRLVCPHPIYHTMAMAFQLPKSDVGLVERNSETADTDAKASRDA